MTQENYPVESQSSGRGGWNLLRTILLTLFRLMIVVLVLLGFAALIYWGVPLIYQEFMVPVEDNTIAIRVLETRQDYTEEFAGQQMEQIGDRLGELELDADSSKEAINELQIGLQQAQGTIDEHGERLTELDGIYAMMDTQADSIAELSDRLDMLKASVETHGRILDEILISTDTPAVDPVVMVEQQLDLLRVMGYLTEARLSLLQDIPQAAQGHLQAAKDILIDMHMDVYDFQTKWLTRMFYEIDLAALSLPEATDVAGEQLVEAWALVAAGLPTSEEDAIRMESDWEPPVPPVESEDVTETPTPTPTPSVEEGTLSPTPEPTQPPTASPTPTAEEPPTETPTAIPTEVES